MKFSVQGGRQEDVHFDKITSRIQKLCYGLNMDFVDPVSNCHVLVFFLFFFTEYTHSLGHRLQSL